MKVSVMWRGNKYTIEIDPNSNLKDLGYELRNLTGVTAETLRLIVPRLNEKGSNLLLPFSDEHSFSSLHESSITEVLYEIPFLFFFSFVIKHTDSYKLCTPNWELRIHVNGERRWLSATTC